MTTGAIAKKHERGLYKARQLALLGLLLQTLHILFGVTAIIGVLVTHAQIGSTEGTVYYSQLRWQLFTFWVALAGYAISLYVFIQHDNYWFFLAVTTWVYYRVFVGFICWRRTVPMKRLAR